MNRLEICFLIAFSLLSPFSFADDADVQAEIEKIENAIKRSTGYEVGCYKTALVCLQSLEKLQIALEDSETHRKAFDTILLTDDSTVADLFNGVVRVSVSSTILQMTKHLTNQRDYEDPEAEKARKVLAEIERLLPQAASLAGKDVSCIYNRKLRAKVDGIQNQVAEIYGGSIQCHWDSPSGTNQNIQDCMEGFLTLKAVLIALKTEEEIETRPTLLLTDTTDTDSSLVRIRWDLPVEEMKQRLRAKICRPRRPHSHP